MHIVIKLARFSLQDTKNQGLIQTKQGVFCWKSKDYHFLSCTKASYNKRQQLFGKKVLDEARNKKYLFITKFIGREEDSRIMTKLFEYGIPYQRVKEHLSRISENIPPTFSILDIKKVIMQDEEMKDLKIYFE